MFTLAAVVSTLLLVSALAEDCGASPRLLASSDFKSISLGDSKRRLAEDCGATRRLESDDVQPTVLDDTEANGSGWHQGTYSHCLEDAHDGMFHHDWARNKGHVSAEYRFDPPRDGCYVIEEYHPGQNQQCSKYLPRNSRVDVDYCKGKSTYTYVDQSQGGGKWNIIGALPFFVGWEGKIKVANNGTDTTCPLGSGCFWVADAFQVTWVSDQTSGCRVPDAMILAATQDSVTSTPNASSAADESKASIPKVKFAFSIRNVNFETIKATQKIEMISGIKTIVASNAGAPTSNIVVALSAGSVVVNVEITLPDQMDVASVNNSLYAKQTTIMAEVASNVNTISGLPTTGNVSVSGFAVSTSTSALATEPNNNSTMVEIKASSVSSSKEAGEKLVLNPAEAISALQTVVDDIAIGLNFPWQRYEIGSDVALNCGAQGWKQSFLYLDPSRSDDAGAPVEFPFDPPEDGCYVVEEFHPEDRCKVPFSSETALTIHYCKGLKKIASVDQTRHGNQWNTVGLLPFFKGFPGKVIVSHPQVGSSVAVADAFRFTRVSKSCSDAETKAFHYIRLAQNAPAVIVDHRHHANTHNATDAKCGQKAIGKSFLAASQGEAKAIFNFEPTSSGCYRVESYHPENEDDEQCTLANNALFEVNWCLGRHTYVKLPLRGTGNQWNLVGHYKYYAGTSGNVISQRARGSIDGEYWVADAVRFTKVAEDCNMIPNVGVIALHISGDELRSLNPATLEIGLTSYPDMRIALEEAIVEATQLSHDSVRLLSIRKGSIIADFEVKGTMDLVQKSLWQIRSQIMERSETGLQRALCRAVMSNSMAECTVTVAKEQTFPAPRGYEDYATAEEASTRQEQVQATPAGFDERWILATIVASSLVVVLAIGICITRYLVRTSSTWRDPVVPISDDGPCYPTKPDAAVVPKPMLMACIDEEKGQPDGDEISLAGSTITPTSLKDDIEIQSLASGT